jgi:hypothetical protein
VGKSKLIEIVVLGLWLLIAVVLFIRLQPSTQYVPSSGNTFIPEKKSYDVKKISIVDGNTFDLILNDDSFSRILAEIPVKTVLESRKKLIDLFNNCEKPRVVLKKKDSDGKWVVDFYIHINSKEIDLIDWMRSNNLVYQ